MEIEFEDFYHPLCSYIILTNQFLKSSKFYNFKYSCANQHEREFLQILTFMKGYLIEDDENARFLSPFISYSLFNLSH